MTRFCVACLLLFGCLSGCTHHREPNSNCEWPNENDAEPLNLNQASQRQHLSNDAEFAEDLAIRYADVHPGPRTRDRCLASLFKAVASSHNLTEEEVRQSLGRRRIGFDLTVMLSFSLLCVGAMNFLVRWLCRLYGPEEEFTTVAIMTTVASTVTSAAGVMLGEVWSGLWEAIRIRNGHMSYRFARIPWGHHRLGLFIAGLALFWLITAFQRWNFRNSKIGT